MEQVQVDRDLKQDEVKETALVAAQVQDGTQVPGVVAAQDGTQVPATGKVKAREMALEEINNLIFMKGGI